MVESEDQFDKKVTGMSEWWTSQGYDKPFINQGKNDFTWENYSKFIRTGEDGDLDRRETYNALSPYLFQGMAKWDDTSGEGVMPSHSSYLPNALREAQNEDGQPMFPPTHAVTKDELINYTIDMAWKDYQQKQILKDQEANRTQERKDNLADQQQAKINEELLAQMNKEQPPLTGRPTIKDVENQYEIPIIQGFDLDMSKKAKETSYQFNPQNTTLLVGDEVFRTKDLRGKGQMVNFEYTRIGNFYYNTELGRYLYGNEIEELKDDENTIIKPGAIGQWVPADQGTKQIWESEGLMLATDEGVGAIVDLRLVRDAASQESTDKSTNGPKVKLIEEQAEQMNSEKGNSKQGDAQYEGDAIFE